jgi:glutathione S-transferase
MTTATSGKLQLYGFLMSQPTRSILMLLKAGNIPFDFVEVNALRGDNRKADFRAVFPSGLVPVIKDADGTCVQESAAILQYLCETRRLPDHWYPAVAKTRATVNFWMHWHHANTRKSTTEILHSRLFPTSVYPKLTRQKEKGEEGIKAMKKTLSFIDDTLKSQPYLAGAQPSIADLLLLPELDQHLPDTFGMIDFSSHKNVSAWIARMQAQKFYEGVLEPVRKAAIDLRQQEEQRAAK